MKPLIIILSIILCALNGMGQYHIKVECFDKNMPAYAVRFTADNWKTSYFLMESFDTGVQGIKTDLSLDITFQECLFMSINGGEKAAIDFAKQLKTVTDCFVWNKRQRQLYNQLYAYRSAHRFTDRIEPKKECCKTTQVY